MIPSTPMPAGGTTASMGFAAAGLAMPYWGFVLIDSPVVLYCKPDTDENGFSHDVKDAFYPPIAEDSRASRVIIFEGEKPPSDLDTDANIIRFTGAAYGRQGFIPKSV